MLVTHPALQHIKHHTVPGPMGVNAIGDRSLRNKHIKRRKRKSKKESETLDLSNSPEKEPFLLDIDI